MSKHVQVILDPLGQLNSAGIGIIVFARIVRQSPIFKSRKTKQQKTMFVTGVTMGLAEWIIDDTCLEYTIFDSADQSRDFEINKKCIK